MPLSKPQSRILLRVINPDPSSKPSTSTLKPTLPAYGVSAGAEDARAGVAACTVLGFACFWIMTVAWRGEAVDG